jgi:hypothetical protein
MSRYLDNPNVVIDVSKIPNNLRPLIKYFSDWCVYGESAMHKSLAKKKIYDIKTFVEDCCLVDDEMYEYGFVSAEICTPVPDEMVAMQLLYHNYRAAQTYLP